MGDSEQFYDEMKKCQACGLRAGCMQVVPSSGNRENPVLMLVGEAPGQEEDERGEPFVGRAGQLLREVLRETKVLNRRNTIVCNVLKCRPPKNKFPSDESPSICVSKWLLREIEMARPQRMLLLGGKALQYVGNMTGVTQCRGQWHQVRGIRTMATFHPSYVLRQEGEGKMQCRNTFERDIGEVAREVAEIEKGMSEGKAEGEPPGSDWERETREHVEEVGKMLSLFCRAIEDRGNRHDASKFEEPEMSLFQEMVPVLKDCEYGSEEYKANLKKIRPAIEHHYAHNRHHPEHNAEGMAGMTLVDLAEMLCDWASASRRNRSGSMEKSLEVNAARFGISEDLASILRNTALEMGLTGEERQRQ